MKLKDLPQTFFPNKANSVFLSLGAMILVVLIYLLIIPITAVGYLTAIFFALISLYFFLRLFPKVSYFKLTADGFEHSFFFKRTIVSWGEVLHLGVCKIKYDNYVGYTLKQEAKASLGQSLNTKMIGYKTCLPNHYGFNSIELAKIMNCLKDEHQKQFTQTNLTKTRILIFGNSGSGKSTIAKLLANDFDLAHLDLDSIAWQKENPTARRPIEESISAIDNFFNEHENWVIEGCYTSLIEHASSRATMLYFLNLDIEQCIENCRNRPWEPHKYPSKEAQDKNLNMLIEWISQYKSRDDDFSYAKHRELFDQYKGPKKEYLKQQTIKNK